MDSPAEQRISKRRPSLERVGTTHARDAAANEKDSLEIVVYLGSLPHERRYRHPAKLVIAIDRKVSSESLLEQAANGPARKPASSTTAV
jgi:hypothetical protein